MKEYFVTFRSITFAQRGQAVLRSAGIPVQLQRTPRWMEEKGCGYSLRLPPGYGAAAVEQLKQSGIPFSRLYLHRDDGGLGGAEAMIYLDNGATTCSLRPSRCCKPGSALLRQSRPGRVSGAMEAAEAFSDAGVWPGTMFDCPPGGWYSP